MEKFLQQAAFPALAEINSPNKAVGPRTAKTTLGSMFNYVAGEKANAFQPKVRDIGQPIANIAPDAFPEAQKAGLSYDPLEYPTMGEYDPERNQVSVNPEYLLNKYKSLVPDEASQITAGSVDTVPHELGHAIYDKDVRNADLRTQWRDLHDTYLSNNKALGDYQYANDPTHSFADAYGLYASNPERLRNHFPEIYNFMKQISGFEYKRPQ